MERAQHAGDVLKGRCFDSAFADGALRFPFKIDNDEIGAGIKHLAEMQIAVAANALGVDQAVGQFAESCVQRSLAAK